jgi:hypothetical protein
MVKLHTSCPTKVYIVTPKIQLARGKLPYMYICKAAETDILHNADKIELPPSQLTPPAQTIFVAVQNMSNNL